MQVRASARDKNAGSATLFAFAPFGRTVLEAMSEGMVVLDASGGLVYANPSARRSLAHLGDLAAQESGALRRELTARGSRFVPVQITPAEVGEAAFLAAGSNGRDHTLADREKQAILETIEATGGRLAEAARRLGISRTTLWRRLRAYGIDRFRASH
jgi:transcriptional regulator with GAF, ATPase, and Fis domain